MLKAVGIAVERPSPLHDLDAGLGLSDALHLDAQAETVEQLGPNLPFLGVHGPDKEESGRV